MRKNRRFLELLMLAALFIVLAGCAKFDTKPGVSEPPGSALEGSGAPGSSESAPGNSGADFTSELSAGSAGSGLPDAGSDGNDLPDADSVGSDLTDADSAGNGLTDAGSAGSGLPDAGSVGSDLPNADGAESAPPGAGAEKPREAMIDPAGMTLETRVRPPEGYVRTEAADGSLAQFLRTYPMKEDGAPVLLYDGSKKGNQGAHVAVFDLPVENRDLQQCADSVMRVYAEYFWHTDQYERIAFHFTNGFLAEYGRWRNGQRIRVDGNTVSWVASGGYDDSYECFQQYMQVVFSYAGTLSMDSEAEPVEPEEIQAGDVFLHGGSPGHVVLVVDICENGSGNKAFLLAQGYMPAQQFHLLKNPAHGDDPWYYVDELTDPLRTPEYTFSMDSLKRLAY